MKRTPLGFAFIFLRIFVRSLIIDSITIDTSVKTSADGREKRSLSKYASFFHEQIWAIDYFSVIDCFSESSRNGLPVVEMQFYLSGNVIQILIDFDGQSEPQRSKQFFQAIQFRISLFR